MHYRLHTDLKLFATICDWILDYLLCRRQTVKVGNFTSRTGTPQGCDCPYAEFNSDQICCDQITVIGMIINDDESDNRNEIELLVKWSNENNLILNVDKTKELIVDFINCWNY